MPDVTLQILDPTLTGSQVFKVRYRLLPAGSYVVIADQTNAPFTVVGLAAGEYEFEFVVQLEDETLCPATTRTILVEDAYTCPTFTVTMSKQPNKLNISYTGGTGTPCNGYLLKYTNPNTTLNLNPLPASPFSVNIPLAVNMGVQILADLCAGGTKLCFNGDITPPAPPACINMTDFDFDIVLLDIGTNIEIYRLTITATQSSPVTLAANISIIQTSFVPIGGAWQTNVITSNSPTPFVHVMQIQINKNIGIPNPIQGGNNRTWNLNLIDKCGVGHFFPISY